MVPWWPKPFFSFFFILFLRVLVIILASNNISSSDFSNSYSTLSKKSLYHLRHGWQHLNTCRHASTDQRANGQKARNFKPNRLLLRTNTTFIMLTHMQTATHTKLSLCTHFISQFNCLRNRIILSSYLQGWCVHFENQAYDWATIK